MNALGKPIIIKGFGPAMCDITESEAECVHFEDDGESTLSFKEFQKLLRYRSKKSQRNGDHSIPANHIDS